MWGGATRGSPRVPRCCVRCGGLMRRDQVELGGGTVVTYGHWGRPFLVFPSEQGRAWDFENNGMIDAVRPLLDAGRAKLYCVPSHNAVSWSNRSLSVEDRARGHDEYERWIVDSVVPFIYADCDGAQEIGPAGCSMGASHPLTFALPRADLSPLSMSFSGSYDPSAWHGWGEQGEAAYVAHPVQFVPGLGGDHLEWLRSRLSVLLVVGQGMWEDTTGALPSTRQMAWLLKEK